MKKIPFFILLASLYFILEAQNDTLTLNMQHASFKEFVDSVEKKINYKIYFANDWVDSMNIDIAADKLDIKQNFG